MVNCGHHIILTPTYASVKTVTHGLYNGPVMFTEITSQKSDLFCMYIMQTWHYPETVLLWFEVGTLYPLLSKLYRALCTLHWIHCARVEMERLWVKCQSVYIKLFFEEIHQIYIDLIPNTILQSVPWVQQPSTEIVSIACFIQNTLWDIGSIPAFCFLHTCHFICSAFVIIQLIVYGAKIWNKQHIYISI